jgi:hypothetical protein
MTTSAPRQDTTHRLRELDEDVRRAWSTYRESLLGLEGAEYEEAEQRCWGRLQRKLEEFDHERASLVGPSDPSPSDHV